MKAQELRIGNWIDNGEGLHFVIDLMSMQDICEGEKLNGEDKLLKGIPLTEEWLLKFGFNKKTDGVFFTLYPTNNNLEITVSVKKDFSFIQLKRVKCEESIIFTEKNFVHQLQNLYYELTGEELKLTTDGVD